MFGQIKELLGKIGCMQFVVVRKALHQRVDFRCNALSCFEASVALQKHAAAFQGASIKPLLSLCSVQGPDRLTNPLGVAAFRSNQ